MYGFTRAGGQMQLQRNLGVVHLAVSVEFGQQLDEVGVDLFRSKVAVRVAGENVDVERAVVHLAEGIAAVAAMTHLHRHKGMFQGGGIQFALQDQQTVEKVMAGVHPHRLGADHRAGLQTAKTAGQLLQHLGDMAIWVKIGTNATQIEHVHHPWLGLI